MYIFKKYRGTLEIYDAFNEYSYVISGRITVTIFNFLRKF